MGEVVFLLQIMGITGRHQRQTEIVGDINRPLGTAFLDVEAIVLDFDVEVVAEDFRKPLRRFAALFS